MESTDQHQSGGPSLEFSWAPYGGVAGEALHTVPQDMVPSAAPPSLPLFTEAQQQDGPQRINSGHPELNIHTRPRRQPRGSKRYRNEEFVSVPLDEDEDAKPTDSGPSKRGRGSGSQTGGTGTPSASAAAAAASAAAATAAAAAATQAVEEPEPPAADIPSTQLVPYHQPDPMTSAVQAEAVQSEAVPPEAVAYHHHEHQMQVSEAEQMVAAAAAAAAAQHEVMQQMSLQLEQELPLPVVPKLPPKQTDPLNTMALQTLASQDAASHDQYLKLLRFDDQIAELASRRGLLVRFVIKSVKTYQPQPEMIVEAPEFMTVEYLKRRIMKAKLLRGEFVNPIRFVMRKKVSNENGDLVGMEDVPSREPTGDEIFLFHQGYEAPGPYELFIASAPQTTDREQQERILGLTRQDSGAVDAARLSYQQLLQAPGMPAANGQMGGMPGASGAMQMGPNGEMPPNSAALGMEMQGVLDGQQVALHSGMLTNGMSVVPSMAVGMEGQQPLYALQHVEDGGAPSTLTEKSPKPRRQTGRWMPEEVEALIEGVSLYKTSWAQIYERYVVTNKINSKRTQVDLKDKWRNLVKLVTDPNKHARGMDLSEEQRQTILRLVFANDVSTADYGTTSADQAAAAAGAELGGEGGGLGEQQVIPVEALPMPDIGQAEMTALLQNMYAQYHQLGMPVPDTDTLQAQIQQHLQQQQFLQQAHAHMTPEDMAAMQAQQLQGLDHAMDPAQLAALQGQMDPQQFAAYQQQLMAQQAQHHHMLAQDLQQYQQVDASGQYHEHYAQQLDEVAAAAAAAEHLHAHHHQQHDGQQAAHDMHAQHHDALDPQAAAALHHHHTQQHVVDPLQPLTEETLDLPPLTAQ